MGNVYCKTCGIRRNYYPKLYNRKSCIINNNIPYEYDNHKWTTIYNEVNILKYC